ncbi:MAG TPA: ABC transporter ATP-binding protein [Clostridia bacterium]|nr:ABC transporter ATP-binding protein [Clostridia bacterium]
MSDSKNPIHDFEYAFSENSKHKKTGNIKILFKLYRDNKLNMILSLLFFVIKHSPVLVIPYITADIINLISAPAKHNINELWIYGIILTVFLIQNIPFHVLHTSLMSKAIRQVEAGLRSSIVRKLQVLSITYHKELKSGKLQSKVLRDVEAVEFLSRQTILSIMPLIINTVASITIIASKSLLVTAFFAVMLPVSFLLIRFFRSHIRSKNASFRHEIEEMSANVSEMIEMIPVTRAHGLEDIEIQRIDSQLEKVKESGYKLDIITAIFGSSNWVVFQGLQIICLFFTSALALKGKIAIGDVVMYQSYFTMLLNMLSNVINIYPQMVKGFESVNSISEILTAEDIEDNNGKIRVKKINGEFKFDKVCYKYSPDDKCVLNDFSLEVKPGECIAFVGESGAGKTTLLNLVIGFLKPTSGKVFMDGIDISKLNLRSFRQNIAVVPQNTLLFSGSIRDNITYGLSSVSEEKLKEVIRMANLEGFIKEQPDGLDTIIGEHGGKLSGGQRQRISIARALIRDPKIIVLDEATSALDSISEKQIQKAMESLVKGRTTFIVAHRLSTIKNADRIIVVKDGICSEYGTYEELMSMKGEFYRLKAMQA